ACTKTGRRVSDVLVDKHPPLRTPDINDPDRIAFRDYGPPPEVIPINCPTGDIEKISRKLRGSTGCSGLTAEALKNMLLRHGRASSELLDMQCCGKPGTAGPPAPGSRTTCTAMNAASSSVALQEPRPHSSSAEKESCKAASGA
ncbi:hypothetical protein ACHAW6_004461, partial [Cyclotella cf. meneghiniana]